MALLPLLLLTNASGANAGGVINPIWPGLPPVPIPDGWFPSVAVGSWGNGLSEVARARQWVKIPAQAVAVPTLSDPRVFFPPDEPDSRLSHSAIEAYLFLSSPAGAKHGYGIGLPTKVRTVAFGAIPVEVGIRLEQVRDADDLPIPLRLLLTENVYTTSPTTQETREDAKITGKVRVRLTELSIDGVDVGLEDCLSHPVELDLTANTVRIGDPLTDPALHGLVRGSTAFTTWMAERGLGLPIGGGISGELEIPAFSDCHSTAGENLAPLLTGAVSGPGNAVTIGWAPVTPLADDGETKPESMCGTRRQGFPNKLPRGPFLGDPSDCDHDFGPPKLDYPTRAD